MVSFTNAELESFMRHTVRLLLLLHCCCSDISSMNYVSNISLQVTLLMASGHIGSGPPWPICWTHNVVMLTVLIAHAKW